MDAGVLAARGRGGKGIYDAALVQRLRAPILKSCETLALETTSKRALRWGGNWWVPMLVGQQTTPWILEGMVGHALDPAKAQAYRAAVVTTCDYFPRHQLAEHDVGDGPGAALSAPRLPPRRLVQRPRARRTRASSLMDPGGRSAEQGQGPWDSAWAQATLHPAIDAWPGNERWFENRCSPLSGEFTSTRTRATRRRPSAGSADPQRRPGRSAELIALFPTPESARNPGVRAGSAA